MKLITWIKSQGETTLWVGFALVMVGILCLCLSMGWVELGE